MAYKQVEWKDFPDTTTPVNANNLNHMDAQIKINETNIGDMSRISDYGTSVTEILDTYCGYIDDIRNKDLELLHSGLIQNAGNITLADGLDNYKFLILTATGHEGAWRTDFVPVSLLKLHPHEWMFFETDHYPRAIITYVSNTVVHVSFGTGGTISGARFLDGIYGLK